MQTIKKVLLCGSVVDYSIYDVGVGYYEALKDLGYETKLFATNRRLEFWGHSLRSWAKMTGQDPPTNIQILREGAMQALIEAAYFQPDIVLVISGMGFHPDACYLLEAHGYQVATVYTESPYDDDKHAEFSKVVSYAFTNDRASVPVLQDTNPNTWYLPTAFNHTRHRDDLEPQGKAEVLFVGTGFGERAKMMAEVNWEGIGLELFGYWGGLHMLEPGKEDYQTNVPSIPDKLQPFLQHDINVTGITNDETVARYIGADVCLNFYRETKRGRVTSMNPRAYELAACGAFQLAQDVPEEAHEIFGDSIAYFSNSAELEAKIRYYLKRPEERKRMAAEAHRRIQGHDYRARVRTLMEHLGNGADSPVSMVRGQRLQYGYSTDPSKRERSGVE